MVSWRKSDRFNRAVEDPLARQDTVAQQGELGQFRRDQHDRQALFGELLDQAVNVCLGPDIDPAGWLVQKQNSWDSLEPLSDDQLLLVAAERARDLLRAPRVNSELLNGPQSNLVRRVGRSEMEIERITVSSAFRSMPAPESDRRASDPPSPVQSRALGFHRISQRDSPAVHEDFTSAEFGMKPEKHF